MWYLLLGMEPIAGKSPTSRDLFVSTRSSKALASRYHFFFQFFYVSLDFHEFCHCVINACLLAELKQQWTTLVLEWLMALVHYSFL